MAPSIKPLGLSLATLLLLGSASPAVAQPTTTDAPLPAPPHTPRAPYILHVSDVHLNTSSTTTTYGQDTGLDLWRSLKAKLQTLIASKTPPAFIIFTGDLPAHYACGPVNCYLPPGQRASHNTNMAVLLEDLRALVSRKNIPLFFIPGNNDGLAGDYFSFADARQKTAWNLVPESRNPYPALNTAPRCGAPPCLVADPHPKMGYYAARPIPGLRLIGLNTIIWGVHLLAGGWAQPTGGGEHADALVRRATPTGGGTG